MDNGKWFLGLFVVAILVFGNVGGLGDSARGLFSSVDTETGDTGTTGTTGGSSGTLCPDRFRHCSYIY